MIKAFLLIFAPSATWDRLSLARRSLGFIMSFHLVPIILLAVFVEGIGIAKWGKWQPKIQQIFDYSTHTVVVFAVIQAALFLAMVLVSALVLLQVSHTFHGRSTYSQAFATVAYGTSPLFLTHMLNVAPLMNPFVPWIMGMLLVIWIMYQGIPRIMQPDPTHAFGLYLSTIIVLLLTSGIASGLPAFYLMGLVDFHNSWLTHQFPGLFQ